MGFSKETDQCNMCVCVFTNSLKQISLGMLYIYIYIYIYIYSYSYSYSYSYCCSVTQSCPTLCDPMDCSMPGNLYGYRGFCGGSVVKNQPEMQETQV